MTVIDWVIVAFAVLLALYGYRRGFLVGVLSFGGFALGAFIGSRVAPLLLSGGSRSPYAPVFALVGAVLLGAAFATGLEGLGFRLRRALTLPGIGAVDGVLGAALSACIALGLAWILGAVALQAPGAGGLRADIQRSAILRRLNSLLPPSGAILNALARFDALPQIAGGTSGVAPPRAAIARNPRVRAAGASVVRILGTACGLGVEGSGWVAAPGIVVTNAHVIAGQQDTVVEPGGTPPDLPVQPIAFDAHDDVAVLRVAGLKEPALPLASTPQPGTAAAIEGYPKDGPFEIRPGRIGAERTVLAQDAYGNGPITRLVTPLRGLVQPGNSGGPLVDAQGRVLTTVFAAVTDSGTHAGFGVPNSIVAAVLAHASKPVGSGPCAG